MRKLLREPVLHFLLIGIALFVGYGLASPPAPDGARIVVSKAMVDDMAREFQKRWNRPPANEELAGMVEAHVRDEIMYREALALGFDRDDPMIKRRLRQKFEVMIEEQDASETPTDADLDAYLTQYAQRFTLPGTVSFDQVVLDVGASPADAERAAAAAKSALLRGADPTRSGRASMLPVHVPASRLDLVGRDFGAEFAGQIEKLPMNEWTGPVRSAFGAHLVRVTARVPGALPPLDAVRTSVARERENERRTAARSESYRKLRERYDVVIESPPSPAVANR